MDYEKLLKMSWNLLKKGFWTYIAATLILTFGSIFIITSAPLAYGYYFMIIKGLKNEKVRVADILEGFRLQNFFRSWVAVIIFVIPYFILLFISNALMYLVLFFFMYAIPLLVIRGYGGVAACKESTKIAITNPVETLILLAINIALPYIGLLALIVGVYVVTPYIEILITSVLFELIGEEYIDEKHDKAKVIQIETSVS